MSNLFKNVKSNRSVSLEDNALEAELELQSISYAGDIAMEGLESIVYLHEGLESYDEDIDDISLSVVSFHAENIMKSLEDCTESSLEGSAADKVLSVIDKTYATAVNFISKAAAWSRDNFDKMRDTFNKKLEQIKDVWKGAKDLPPNKSVTFKWYPEPKYGITEVGKTGENIIGKTIIRYDGETGSVRARDSDLSMEDITMTTEEVRTLTEKKLSKVGSFWKNATKERRKVEAIKDDISKEATKEEIKKVKEAYKAAKYVNEAGLLTSRAELDYYRGKVSALSKAVNKMWSNGEFTEEDVL